MWFFIVKIENLILGVKTKTSFSNEKYIFKKSVSTVIENMKSHVQHSPLVMKSWEQSRNSFTLKSTGLFLVLGRLLFLSV